MEEPKGAENMISIRDLFERTCQTFDIRNPIGSGKDFDKYSLEEWVTMQGGGASALASVRVWTRVHVLTSGVQGLATLNRTLLILDGSGSRYCNTKAAHLRGGFLAYGDQ